MFANKNYVKKRQNPHIKYLIKNYRGSKIKKKIKRFKGHRNEYLAIQDY